MQKRSKVCNAVLSNMYHCFVWHFEDYLWNSHHQFLSLCYFFFLCLALFNDPVLIKLSSNLWLLMLQTSLQQASFEKMLEQYIVLASIFRLKTYALFSMCDSGNYQEQKCEYLSNQDFLDPIMQIVSSSIVMLSIDC